MIRIRIRATRVGTEDISNGGGGAAVTNYSLYGNPALELGGWGWRRSRHF